MEEIKNFIGGEFLAAKQGAWLENYEPATGQVSGRIADSGPEDIELAVQAARRAFPAWSMLAASSRAKILRKIAALMEERLEEFAQAESRDTGKPIRLAREVDIPRSISNFEFFADACTQFASESHAMEGVALNYTLRQPLGVVGCISPWNLPLYLLSWKVAPALAAGNCVVAKPSEVTPLTAKLLGEVCVAAGLPAGVLNLVQGTGPRAGAALVAHPDVSAVSFTGSTRVGQEITRVTGPAFKKVSLELGGKNANLIFADCDFEDALATSLRSSFSNQGQICLCGSRILIERPLYERFRDEFVKRVKALRQGDPSDPATEQGAVVSKAHHEKVLACIETARQEGGTILCGGKATQLPGRCEKGWFIEPTVIEGLQQNCRTNQEEIFGPVVTLQPFDREEEALEWANATRYGLAATLWTRDLKRAHRMASQIKSGIVWINCWMLRDLRTPFGGVKDSGVGREGGWEALRFFTEPKNVCVKL
jgi:aminomuconate-semialdehyde/2-hydroxymuconate-6-semialdehyde dehydrogenase